MRAILFDLDGVIYQGNRPIEGARETLEWVLQQRIPHLFVTNTTSKPRSAIVRKLAAMGIEVDPERIRSPPVAAMHWLQDHSAGSVALFVPDATLIEFNAIPHWNESLIRPPAAVVVGDLAEAWSFQRLNLAFHYLMQEPHPALIALGMTRYWKTDKGLQLDAGPFVAALQYATGIEPVVLGKPAAAFFRTGVETLGYPPEETLMIGDDIRGDVEGAQKAGLRAALVRTGKFQADDLEGPVRPDAVLDSIAELPTWWESHSATD